MSEMKKHKLMDVLGINLFLKKFNSTIDKVELPPHDYTKYDLLVRAEELKYIEIKCNSDITNPYVDHYITKSDWEWLIQETPTGSKALYILFDDNSTIVYDLKAIHNLNLYYEGEKLNYTNQMDKLNAKMETFVFLNYPTNFKNKTVKMYLQGSKKLLGLSVKDLNLKIAQGTLTQQDVDEVYRKINENF